MEGSCWDDGGGGDEQPGPQRGSVLPELVTYGGYGQVFSNWAQVRQRQLQVQVVVVEVVVVVVVVMNNLDPSVVQFPQDVVDV